MPVLAQNVEAMSLLAESASGAVGEAAAALDDIGVDVLGIEGGRIDLRPLRDAEEPLQRIASRVGEVR